MFSCDTICAVLVSSLKQHSTVLLMALQQRQVPAGVGRLKKHLKCWLVDLHWQDGNWKKKKKKDKALQRIRHSMSEMNAIVMEDYCFHLVAEWGGSAAPQLLRCTFDLDSNRGGTQGFWPLAPQDWRGCQLHTISISPLCQNFVWWGQFCTLSGLRTTCCLWHLDPGRRHIDHVERKQRRCGLLDVAYNAQRRHWRQPQSAAILPWKIIKSYVSSN